MNINCTLKKILYLSVSLENVRAPFKSKTLTRLNYPINNIPRGTSNNLSLAICISSMENKRVWWKKRKTKMKIVISSEILWIQMPEEQWFEAESEDHCKGWEKCRRTVEMIEWNPHPTRHGKKTHLFLQAPGSLGGGAGATGQVLSSTGCLL